MRNDVYPSRAALRGVCLAALLALACGEGLPSADVPEAGLPDRFLGDSVDSDPSNVDWAPPREMVDAGAAPAPRDAAVGCPARAWSGDYVIHDEASWNTLQAYTAVDGDLIVSTMLRQLGPPLSCLQDVAGALVILDNPRLTDLTGLELPLRVSGGLRVRRNPSLRSLRALSQLRFVGESAPLWLQELPALQDLQGVSDAAHAFDGLIVEDTGLTDLRGLAGLESLTTLRIRGNARLTSLLGLGGIRTLEGNLGLEHNPELLDISALSRLSTVSGISIIGNARLPTAAPLSGLTGSVRALTVSDNPELLRLPQLDAVDEVTSIEVRGNAALVELTGLGSVTRVGEVKIYDNPHLTSLRGIPTAARFAALSLSDLPRLSDLSGLEGLQHVEGSFTVHGAHGLRSLGGLGALRSAQELRFTDCNLLENLTGLGSLQEVTERLSIASNRSLRTLTGLPSLARVGDLVVSNNAALTDVTGLAGTSSVGTLTIQHNRELPQCQVDDLLAQFELTCDHCAANGGDDGCP